MSNSENDKLKDLAWDMACERYDATVPDEIVATEAEKIYEQLLSGELPHYHIVPASDQWMRQQEENFINSYSE